MLLVGEILKEPPRDNKAALIYNLESISLDITGMQ